MPDFVGLSHIALTVTDLNRSARWYEEVFGLEHAETVRDVYEPGHDIVVLLHPGTDIAINLHLHSGNDADFDESRTGLDHVSLLVRDRRELTRWQSHLDDLGVNHSPIVDEDYGSVLVFGTPTASNLNCSPTRRHDAHRRSLHPVASRSSCRIAASLPRRHNSAV